ncbi:hypothetical protein PoB_001145600 [Plakobranchus ocellatus]|uniref:Uncharacterized protein n=1 Tax=Plakobranchus ocellatus TaxID=259542 RepID=A0AAV3YC94_9GAST|nr:hypothetical protein PoB_001145600 [Plakobranchus ocellatus]
MSNVYHLRIGNATSKLINPAYIVPRKTVINHEDVVVHSYHGYPNRYKIADTLEENTVDSCSTCQVDLSLMRPDHRGAINVLKCFKMKNKTVGVYHANSVYIDFRCDFYGDHYLLVVITEAALSRANECRTLKRSWNKASYCFIQKKRPTAIFYNLPEGVKHDTLNPSLRTSLTVGKLSNDKNVDRVTFLIQETLRNPSDRS